MQVPILSGIYTDEAPDFRTRYPRNLVPVPKGQGISNGYLRPASGIVAAGTGPGIGRGGINWNGKTYRVMGSKLVRVEADGTVVTLGDVGNDSKVVSMDYSFDVLAIASAGKLYYWDGSFLSVVTDPDIGVVIDVMWIAGYFMTTDGTSLVVTELTNRMSVNPLKYGSSEADPDPILAVEKLRNEAYALNRYTIECFQNIGGNLFPFQRIEGAQVPRGVIGTHAYTEYLSSFAFVGSARKEAPSVYLMTAGDSSRIATREVDQTLARYSEAQLAQCVLETRVDKGHQHLLLHLPDLCMVYDAAASEVAGEPVWHTLTTSIVGDGTYRARDLVWCYDRWNVADPTSNALGTLSDTVSSHYGQVNGWDFGTAILYNEGKGAILQDLELVALTGRVAFGADPVIWTSYSEDGETWSQERPTRTGSRGQRGQRISWRRQGRIRNWRIQRFRGTSDAHVSFARLEVQMEPLYV
jgi:Phage stabilisation protein